MLDCAYIEEHNVILDGLTLTVTVPVGLSEKNKGKHASFRLLSTLVGDLA